MRLFSQLLCRRAKLLILIACLGVIGREGFSAPPAAPTNLKVEFTRFGFPYNNEGIQTNNSWFSWYLSWDDNALDEDGYHIQARFGNAGPFYNQRQLSAGSRFARISTGIPDAGLGRVQIQFKVIPWKFNGTGTESSEAILTTFIPPRDSKSEITAPSNLTVTSYDADPVTTGLQADDGKVQLVWLDNSSGELYQRIRMRESIANQDAEAGWLTVVPAEYGSYEIPINKTSLTISNRDFVITKNNPIELSRIQLIPGKTYEFEVGAGNTYTTSGDLNIPINYTVKTSAPHFTTPTLAAPTLFSASSLGESAMSLSWKDNSNNEMGYEVQYRRISQDSDPPWLSLGTVGENVTNVSLPIVQTATAQLRVRAFYSYRPTSATTNTVLNSAFSNTATASTTEFRAPTQLAAVTSGVSKTIDLSWRDNSTTEVGFNVYCRPAGSTEAYQFCRATPANMTKVSVNSFTSGSPFNSNSLTFTTFAVGSAYEFVVRAVGNQEEVESLNSNSVSAFAREGFTNRLYQPIQENQSFNHRLTVGSQTNFTRFEATGLPAGLNLDANSGVISGTPSVTGYFSVPIRAVFQDYTATSNLQLRVLPALAGPILAEGAAVGDRRIGLNDTLIIPLQGRFTDADTKAAVRVITTKGTLDIGMFVDLTPQAVQNFVNYASNGDYTQMVFHRLEKDFVLQGGFLKAVSAPRTFTSVNARPSPINEPGISNLFGTVACAKLGERTSYERNALGEIVNDSSGNPKIRETGEAMGYVGNPDSASIDFFFNLGNNSQNLDNQNGGFTAFGRVGTPGLQILQQINQLPIGSYLNNNTGSSNNANLDKRIILDGSLFPLTKIPMDATTAPADMDIEKTIRVTSIQPLSPVNYSVDSQSTNIATVIVEGTNLRIVGLSAGTRPITVTARDIDGNTATTSFSLSVTPGYRRPVITRQPAHVVTRANTTVRFTVSATGTAVSYRWRKNGTIIAGQSGQGSPSYTLVSVQNSDEAEYDVVVFNEAESIISSKAKLEIIKPPVIAGSLESQLVEVGSSFELVADLTEGAPSPTFTWRRGATVVPRQTTKALRIASASLSDAGIYQASARNSAGAASTGQATIVVIDKRPSLQVETPNSNVRLTAQVSGPDLNYQWYRILPDNTYQRINGAENPVLNLLNANPQTDIGSYACEVTIPDGIDSTNKHFTGTIVLALSNRPIISNLLTLADAIVGANYDRLPEYGFNNLNNITSIRISGLPPGLTYNASTGRIFGRPTRPGNYMVSFSASNKAGSSNTVQKPMRVFSMGSGLSGTFTANVDAIEGINQNKGGRVVVAVTNSGTFTAQLQMGREQFRGSGNMVLINTASDSNGNTFLVYLGSTNIPRPGRSNLNLAFQIVEGNQSFNGVINDGNLTATFEGYRQIWNTQFRQGPLIMLKNQRISETLRHNVLLSIPDNLLSRSDLPQGDSYLSATVTLSGTVNIVGRMSDGARFTASSILSPYITETIDDETSNTVADTITRSKVVTPFFQTLNAGTAALMGDLEFMISDRLSLYLGTSDFPQELPPANQVKGTARWIKDQQPTSDRFYRTGFDAVNLNAVGSLYQSPGTNRLVLNLPNVAGNAVLDFSKANVETATPNPDLPSFRITTAHTALITGSNPANVRLTINPSTGLISGSFSLADRRNASFEGLCISASQSEPKLGYRYRLPFGGGFFHLASTTATNAPFLAGKFQLKTPTITFTTQPVSRTVNPGSGTSVTFTAAAVGMPGLSYQWFQNGNMLSNGGSFSGADTNTLEIRGVQQVNAGSYVCVAYAGSISVPSNAAILTVRSAVSSVTLTRTPEATTINSGTSVTFNASVQGSPDIEYRWFRNDVRIEGATGPSYSFIASSTNAGTYKVSARNDLNAVNSFITSTGVSLSVNQITTTVTLTRSPLGEVRPGSSVTFTAVADGDGEKTYSWFKNGEVIPSVSGSSYTLNDVQTDANGTYKCRVISSNTSAPVDSNEVSLTVANTIRNVVASRSPSDQHLASGTTNVTFTVSSEGGGDNKTYLWRKGVVELQNSSSPNFTILTARTEDSGDYNCIVTSSEDPTGAQSNTVNLSVMSNISSASISLTSPSLTTVFPGTPIVLKASVSGDSPSYQWFENNTAMNANITATTDELQLLAPTEVGTYEYKVDVTNPVTTSPIVSNIITIQVIASP